MVGMKAIVRMKKRTVPMSMSELLYKIKSFGARRKLFSARSCFEKKRLPELISLICAVFMLCALPLLFHNALLRLLLLRRAESDLRLLHLAELLTEGRLLCITLKKGQYANDIHGKTQRASDNR